jgi:hypothetical protein
MFAAGLHTAMRFWLFKVPTENIGTMRLFDIADLPFLIAFSPRAWFENVARLRIFQSNLTERQWASLAEIYPRNMMWAYAYQLFFWGRYCGVLSDILAHPDKCILAEVFLRYICQIDVYIDSFDSRMMLRSAPCCVRNNPKVRMVAAELSKRLRSLDISQQTKRSIARLIVSYRRDALDTVKSWGETLCDSLTGVIEVKERTVGNMMFAWSQILSYLYQVPSGLAKEVSEVFFNFAMALQFIDDLSDVGVDYQVTTQNLFLAIVQGNPMEWDSLRAYLDKGAEPFMNWPWVKTNLPKSYLKMRKLHESYIQAIQKSGQLPGLTNELSAILGRLRALVGYESLSDQLS